jgi:hypothetical protein
LYHLPNYKDHIPDDHNCTNLKMEATNSSETLAPYIKVI